PAPPAAPSPAARGWRKSRAPARRATAPAWAHAAAAADQSSVIPRTARLLTSRQRLWNGARLAWTAVAAAQLQLALAGRVGEGARLGAAGIDTQLHAFHLARGRARPAAAALDRAGAAHVLRGAGVLLSGRRRRPGERQRCRRQRRSQDLTECRHRNLQRACPRPRPTWSPEPSRLSCRPCGGARD